MENMRNVRLTVRRDGDGSEAGTCYVTLRAQIVGEGGGVEKIDWFFRREEFGGLRGFKIRDLYRTLDSYGGDDVLIADMTQVYDRGRKIRGVAQVPFYAATIPAFIRRWMLRLVRRVWDHPAFVTAGRYERPQVEIEISEARIARMLGLYGYGKGQVAVDVGGAEGEARMAVFSKDPDFLAKVEQLVQIARNSTRGFHQTATLKIHPYDRDAECWWVAKTPRGQTILSGGLIFHGSHDGFGSGSAPTFAVTLERCDGWSIHT